jgi:two-component system, NtrC family, sensor kinase
VVRPFPDAQIALLQTFADQAVIAIENVRLFRELEARNRELTTALDTQTATSDILRVISHSQADVQPVFDAIVNSAVRLLRARSGTLSRVAGDQIELAAHTSTDDAGDAATRAAFPQPLTFEGVHAQTIRNRAPLNIADAQTDPRLPEATHTYAQVRGYRSQGAVPMLRHDEAIGAIAVTRRDPGGFTDEAIALLQTFAEQAVIAIENVRLFKSSRRGTRSLPSPLPNRSPLARSWVSSAERRPKSNPSSTPSCRTPAACAMPRTVVSIASRASWCIWSHTTIRPPRPLK